MPRPLLRAAPAAVLLAATYACWVPDPFPWDNKACDDAHACLPGTTCLASRCVETPPGQDAATPVVVTRSVLHVQEDGGLVAIPESMPGAELLVETDAGVVALAPAVASPGLSIFWLAEPSPYLLHLGARYFASDAGALDLSEPVLGRADLSPPSNGTTLQSQADCLNSWDPLDEIRLTAVGAGLAGLDLAAVPGWTAPSSGTGQLRTTQSWAGPLTPGLIQTTRGDRPIYVQEEHSTFTTPLPDGGSVTAERWSATRAVTPSTLVMTDGVQTIVSKDCMRGLAVKPQSAVTALGSAYGSHLEEISSAATPDQVTVAVEAGPWPTLPGALLTRMRWATPDDLPLNVQFGDSDPTPAAWPRRIRLTFQATVAVPLQLDGGTAGALEPAALSSTRPYPPSGGTLQPAVSPPVAVRVNGTPAASGVTGAGLQPVVSWDPPLLGTPTIYEVALWREQDPSRQKARQLVAALWTDGTSLHLPPGLLQPRATYVLHVRAIAAPLDARLAPLVAGLPYDDAEAVTGLIEP